MLRLLTAGLVALGLGQGALAQDNGPFQLPAGGFGVPGFGQRQALPSDAMEEARRLGLFEETLDIRSGWIDRVAKMTGHLDIMTAAKDADGQPVSLACTGTAITPRYILTNAHCLKSSGRHRAISVLFLPNYRDARRRNAVTAYPVPLTPVERGSKDTLDYAILRLETPLVGYESLGLAFRDPGPGEPLVVIGHPEGQPLHLSRGRCRSDHEVPMDGEDVVHSCATLAGSSGSLVFSSEGQIVGLHFWGGALLGGRQVNLAIRMATLVKESAVLRDVFEEELVEPQPIVLPDPLVIVDDWEDPVVVVQEAPLTVPMEVPNWMRQEKGKASFLSHQVGAMQQRDLAETVKSRENAENNWQEFWEAGIDSVRGCWIAADDQEFLATISDESIRLTHYFVRLEPYWRGLEIWYGDRLTDIKKSAGHERYKAGAPTGIYVSEHGVLRWGNARYNERSHNHLMLSGWFEEGDEPGFLKKDREVEYEAIKCPD